MKFPINVNDASPYNGTDANGEEVTFPDLLSPGDIVGSYEDPDGNVFGPWGKVVKKKNGLWIEKAKVPNPRAS